VAGWQSSQAKHAPERCEAMAAIKVDIPKSYKEAMESPQAEEWRSAMDEQMAALAQHQTWELKELPTGVKTFICGWVFDLKLDKYGNILRCKARLVAKGYLQQPGVD
jgi:hypothetical protein